MHLLRLPCNHTHKLSKAMSRLCHGSRSEEVGLLHDAEKLLFVDLTVSITISLIDHFLQLLIRHAFTKLLGNALEVLERYFASLVVVKEAESLQDFILRVAIQDLMGHHLEKLFILNGTAAIIIHIRD